jgi:hypothetical protein
LGDEDDDDIEQLSLDELKNLIANYRKRNVVDEIYMKLSLNMQGAWARG